MRTDFLCVEQFSLYHNSITRVGKLMDMYYAMHWVAVW